jgi:hypothetical protein
MNVLNISKAGLGKKEVATAVSAATKTLYKKGAFHDRDQRC